LLYGRSSQALRPRCSPCMRCRGQLMHHSSQTRRLRGVTSGDTQRVLIFELNRDFTSTAICNRAFKQPDCPFGPDTDGQQTLKRPPFCSRNRRIAYVLARTVIFLLNGGWRPPVTGQKLTELMGADF